MKRLVKCLLMTAVVLAGMMVVGADRAEARRWVRRAPARVIVPRYRYYYARPYARPGIHVYAPGVRVNVGPRGAFYGYRGSVVAPGVHVRW